MYTIEELIERANNVHNSKYQYDVSTYTKVSSKMRMICPIHGEFYQSMHQHINKGQGCPMCGVVKRVNTKKYTTENFIEKAKEIHGDRYDYSKTEYVDSLTKVCIICKEHGEFWQRPDGHLQGKGCPKCSNGIKKERTFNKKMNFDEYVDKCNIKFNNKFNYTNNGYKNLSSKVEIVCPEHGSFITTASTHLNSRCGCPKCSYIEDSNRKLSNNVVFIEKAKEIHGDKYDYTNINYISVKEPIEIVCKTHGKFKQLPYNHLSGNGCPKCALVINNISNKEDELFEYIRSVYNGEIIRNDRTVLDSQELDIYLPNINIAFEFDGLFWHSEAKKSNYKYHLDKTEKCLKNGIKLIHIFEDEWDNKKEICCSRIKNILGITDNIIYARKCIIREVDSNASTLFLSKNHIQSNTKSSVKLGLYYNNELVSLMTFGSLRKNLGRNSENGKYELIRFCNKLDCSVIGGASKLLKYFITNYNPQEIISYADRRWSNGNLYEKLNFKLSHVSKPSYFYVIDNKRVNRFSMRKDILISKYGCKENETEHSFCLKNNWYRIYDCGTLVYVWSNN